MNPTNEHIKALFRQIQELGDDLEDMRLERDYYKRQAFEWAEAAGAKAMNYRVEHVRIDSDDLPIG